MARTVAFFYTLFLHCLVFLVGLLSYPKRVPGSVLSAVVKADVSCCSLRFFLQVLYKTAWSESIGRDCTAFCAKKWGFSWVNKNYFEPISKYINVLIFLRYADHLHRFHENDENLWAGPQLCRLPALRWGSLSVLRHVFPASSLPYSSPNEVRPLLFTCLQRGSSPLGGSLRL